MADYDQKQRGGILLPIPTGTGKTALRLADPAIYFALEYFAYVLNKTIGPVLIELGAIASMTFTAAVAHTTPLDPKPHLQEQHFEFPLLACYRVRGTTDDVTLALRHGTYRIGVEYILPPLQAGAAEILVPLLTAAHAALDEWTVQGWDPAFTPSDGAPGDQPFDAAFARVERIEFREVSWGMYAGAADLPMHGITMFAEVRERSEELPDSAFADFAGADVSLDVKDAAGSIVTDLAVVATQLDPEFTSSTPAVAPVAGGTALAIAGKRFRNPVRVWIAGEQVAAVVVSSTLITCSSPLVPDYMAGGSFDLEIDCDGQSVVAADAFTFTA